MKFNVIKTEIDFTEEQIMNEPMFFCASLDFAYSYKESKITKEFLNHPEIQKVVCGKPSLNSNEWYIDSRVHMLKQGWFPCIGGWHLDDVPRGLDSGQPLVSDIEKDKVFHILCCVGNTSMPEFLVSNRTEFLIENIYNNWKTKYKNKYNKSFYGYANEYINLLSTEKERKKIESGDIVFFDQTHFHRGTFAQKNGWRFFIRFSYGVKRKFRNKIRKQVQVYMDTNKGW